ncbi:MAG: hypothetical protein IPN67_18585 [Bacteroidales bacterium]|nr:hypothetical protein [Bacteroidales bacterium]
MIPGLAGIVIKSVRFYKRPVLYQVLIVALLSAVITGSLLTGWSVRASLKKTAAEHHGNAAILITSGTRTFDLALAERLRDSAKLNSTGVLEINGFCQNLSTQKGVYNTHIFAVSPGFFRFQGCDTVRINSGEVAVNEKIANSLGLKKGDDLIIRFNETGDIPADAPFAPAKEEGRSVVMKVGIVLGPAASGNFSLEISQAVPENIFINLQDIIKDQTSPVKINRLLVANNNSLTAEAVYDILKKAMQPSDLGLRLIPLRKTGGYELRSDRTFIESSLIGEIHDQIPASAPLITYLGNRFSCRTASAPYSFISALPESLYPEIPEGNDMIINRWLAEDLAINKGDTIEMAWYAPDSLSRLIEKKENFCVKRIVDMEGIWADSLLMPDFPGISGSESCSEWDAGVPVKLKEIRQKDEAYWNKFKGTPKAFISYDKGTGLWGNNFGPATAIRFPEDIGGAEILERLSGNLDPAKNGLRIIDLFNDSQTAASESVDFSTLFLSLGFFLILAAVVLLSFAVTTYLESKHSQIRTYFALGFRTRWIGQLLMAESGSISLMGCFIGSFAGILTSMLIIRLLNTVWQGAVQTNTLSAFFSLTPVFTGFLISAVLTGVFLVLKIRLHLKKLNRGKKTFHSPPSRFWNLIFLVFSLMVSLAFFILSVINRDKEILLCFVSGSILLVFMILLWRYYLIRPGNLLSPGTGITGMLSKLYYSYYPSHAVVPVLFIAAGIFAVFITGANRMSFNGSQLKPSGGTGGFLLWCDNTIPVRSDLATTTGRAAYALDDAELSEMRVVQIKRFAGDDASCLNLNHVKAPPVLGADPSEFISRGSFSFASAVKRDGVTNPWEFLSIPASENTIYGIADQTVLEWGLKIKPGDTLIIRSENGQRLNIIIAAGLKSSVFQGYILIGLENFKRYFPSVPGTSVFLVDGDKNLTDLYRNTLNERFENNGLRAETTNDRLAAFNEVTNTYLSVFGVFGALGMVTGIAGLGFVLLRNYNYRKREFGLMLATGFPIKRIRRLVFSEQLIILSAGIISGVLPAVISTLPSLKSSADIPWLYLVLMVIVIFVQEF